MPQVYINYLLKITTILCSATFNLLMMLFKIRIFSHRKNQQEKIHGLIHIHSLHHHRKKNLGDQPVFFHDDKLKLFFQNEINAYHVTGNQSDEDIAKYDRQYFLLRKFS